MPIKLRLTILVFFLLTNIAFAGDFIDTRITFAVSDDNILRNAGTTNPSSPLPSFIPGARSTLFFDNYNTRFSGFESLSHVVLYKKMPGFIKNLETAAALVVRMSYWLEQKQFRLRDSGSYLEIKYHFHNYKKSKLKRNLTIVTFPLSSDRFRLGYSYSISWGGDITFPRRTIKSPVPGMKLQYNYDINRKMGFFAFAGAKTALLQQLVTKEQIEEETVYGVLGGLGFRYGGFQVQAGGAFFQKGTFFNPAVKALPASFWGTSAEVSYSHGMPIGVSIDFQLYRNDPQMPARFFRMEKYTPGKLSFAVAMEASYVNNVVEDPVTLGDLTDLPGIAADLNFRMKYGYLRVHADLVYRDLGFILTNVPGIVPFQGFSEEQKLTPEFFFAVGFDYFIKSAYLTIGLKGGVQLPAYFETRQLSKEVTGNVAPESLQGETIVVVRNEGDWVFVPAKDQAGNANTILPVISFKANFKWQLSPFMAMIGELLFSVDQNTTRLTFEKDQVTGTVIPRRDFDYPYLLGFNLMLQARF